MPGRATRGRGWGDDDPVLAWCVENGWTIAEIADLIERTGSAVTSRMWRLGLSVRLHRRRYHCEEEAARLRALDPVHEPIARAVEWLIVHGHEVDWVYPDHVRLRRLGTPAWGPPLPVTWAPKLANRLGAEIPYPGTKHESAA